MRVPAPKWRFTAPADMYVMRAVMDLQGNTFVLLGTNVVFLSDGGTPPPYSLWLYGFDADGNQRFRVDLTRGTPGLDYGVMLMADPDADVVYLAARTYNYATATTQRAVVAQARNATTGGLIWERNLHQGITLTNSSDGQMWLDVSQAMLLSPRVLALSLVEGASLHEGYLVGLSTADGSELWRHHRGGHMYAGATANGDLWENSAACWSQDHFLSRVSATGVSGPRQLLPLPLLAFGQDRVVTSQNNQLGWLSPSFVVTPVQLLPQHTLTYDSQVRLEGPLLTLVTRNAQSRPTLDRYDDTTGAWQWSVLFDAGTVAQVWLLRDGGVATSLSMSDGGMELVTHTNTGAEFERCPYGKGYGLGISQEQYLTLTGNSLTVFDLPGRAPATSGWTGPNGFAGTGRAR